MMRYSSLGRTGLKLSAVSFGGSGYGNVYGRYDERAVINGLKYGLDCGINYIDTAPWYGQGTSESFLGKALSGMPRSKYFIGTKVGRYERDVHAMFNFTADKVKESIEESLRRLKLDYVDLLQIHDVEFAPSVEILLEETLPALEAVRDKGLCRYIGITGYPLPNLRDLIEKSHINVDSILSYCRLTLNDSSLVQEFNFYKSRNVGIINASPLAMGLLVQDPNVLQSWHPADEDIKAACNEAVKYCQQNGVDISHLAVNHSTCFDMVRM